MGRCLEKSGILEMAATMAGDGERRGNSLADYPIIRFSGTFAIYVSASRPFPLRREKAGFRFSASSLFSSLYRSVVGIFVFISQSSSARFLSIAWILDQESSLGSRMAALRASWEINSQAEARSPSLQAQILLT
jgi:hypothetical protein